MVEPLRRTETLRAAGLRAVGPVTLAVVERVVRCEWRGGAQAWVMLTREPHALVVHDGSGLRALAMDASALSLPQLCEWVPGLAAMFPAA